MDRAVERLTRIASAHAKDVDDEGGTWGVCAECGWAWPCPTYHWAASESVDPILDPWNPADADDEASGQFVDPGVKEESGDADR